MYVPGHCPQPYNDDPIEGKEEVESEEGDRHVYVAGMSWTSLVRAAWTTSSEHSLMGYILK